MTDRRIRGLIKQGAITALAAANVFPTNATPKDDLLSLMRSLHPRLAPGGLIRMGSAGDGGYLVPDDLDGIAACFSPGVGGIVGFEQDCVARGIPVFMADGSVEAPIVGNPSYSFIRKFVGAINSPCSTTMDEWVRTALPYSQADLLLQIDIEGFEYETILNMSDALVGRFRVIAAEFHTLDQLWSRPFFGIAARAFEKILRTHSCVHIHPNNCTGPIVRDGLSIPPVMEFTFLRNDRMKGEGFAVDFPNPLDADNTDDAHLALPTCWFRAA
jgi:hypothetical protein